MDKEILWNNKENIINKLYITLLCLIVVYLILNVLDNN